MSGEEEAGVVYAGRAAGAWLIEAIDLFPAGPATTVLRWVTEVHADPDVSGIAERMVRLSGRRSIEAALERDRQPA